MGLGRCVKQWVTVGLFFGHCWVYAFVVGSRCIFGQSPPVVMGGEAMAKQGDTVGGKEWVTVVMDNGLTMLCGL